MVTCAAFSADFISNVTLPNIECSPPVGGTEGERVGGPLGGPAQRLVELRIKCHPISSNVRRPSLVQLKDGGSMPQRHAALRSHSFSGQGWRNRGLGTDPPDRINVKSWGTGRTRKIPKWTLLTDFQLVLVVSVVIKCFMPGFMAWWPPGASFFFSNICLSIC